MEGAALTDSNPRVTALRNAMQISAIGFEMAAPAVLGSWVDQRLGTRYFTIIGLLIGLPLGFWHLFQLAAQSQPKKSDSSSSEKE